MPLIGAPQGQHNWWTKGLVGSRKDPEELDWRLDNSEECGSGREKSETNPSDHGPPPVSQTGRPAELARPV